MIKTICVPSFLSLSLYPSCPPYFVLPLWTSITFMPPVTQHSSSWKNMKWNFITNKYGKTEKSATSFVNLIGHESKEVGEMFYSLIKILASPSISLLVTSFSIIISQG